jgi:hypothetical protein
MDPRPRPGHDTGKGGVLLFNSMVGEISGGHDEIGVGCVQEASQVGRVTNTNGPTMDSANRPKSSVVVTE